MKNRTLLVLTALASLSLLNAARAEDHALLIGMSVYPNALDNLPTSANDATLMRDVLIRKLRFKDSQIRTITNEQATHEGVKRNILEWLVRGVSEGDRTVLYYSGHGTRFSNPSKTEEGGCESALATYDYASNGPLGFDELSTLLGQIPARESLLLLDSCFSGSATKSLITGKSLPGGYKFAVSDATLVCNDAINKATRIQDLVPNPKNAVVASKFRIQMTASANNEVAYSAGGGSLFTQALVSALNTLPTNTSFKQVQAVATKYIRDRTTQLGRIPSTPQLFVIGDQRFLDASIFNFGKLISNPLPLPFTPPEQTSNVTQLFDTVLSGSNFKVELKSAKTNYAFNDKVTYQIASSQDGYLHLFEIDDQGNVGLLFPNQYSPDNKIRASVGNPLNFPDNDQYSIVALPPASKSRVVALVTTGRSFNLFRDGPGNVQAGFRLILGADAIRQLSSLLYKDKILGIVGNASSASHGATQVIVTTGL